MNNTKISDMKKISEKSFALGYEMAQNRYSKLDTRPKTSEEWGGFFHGVIQDCSNLEWNCGAAAFVTSEEAKNLNVGLLNKELSSLQKASKQYCHDSRMVDRLLPYPDYLDEQGSAIEIPISLRPDYSYDSFFEHGTGKLGRVYLKEMGMHTYLPHCDIFDSDDPELLLSVGNQLDETSVKISELLMFLQSIHDPEKMNPELTKAIERCKNYENGGSSLPGVLKKHGIGVVNLSRNNEGWVNYQEIHTNALYLELDKQDHLQVVLEPGTWSNGQDNPFDATEAKFDFSCFIREAINRACGK